MQKAQRRWVEVFVFVVTRHINSVGIPINRGVRAYVLDCRGEVQDRMPSLQRTCSVLDFSVRSVVRILLILEPSSRIGGRTAPGLLLCPLTGHFPVRSRTSDFYIEYVADSKKE